MFSSLYFVFVRLFELAGAEASRDLSSYFNQRLKEGLNVNTLEHLCMNLMEQGIQTTKLKMPKKKSSKSECVSWQTL